MLRPFALDDAPTVQRLLRSPDIKQTTLQLPYPYPEVAAESWIGTHAERARVGLALY